MSSSQISQKSFQDHIDLSTLSWMKSCVKDEIPLILFGSKIVIFDYIGVDEVLLRFTGVKLTKKRSTLLSFLVNRKDGTVYIEK